MFRHNSLSEEKKARETKTILFTNLSLNENENATGIPPQLGVTRKPVGNRIHEDIWNVFRGVHVFFSFRITIHNIIDDDNIQEVSKFDLGYLLKMI